MDGKSIILLIIVLLLSLDFLLDRLLDILNLRRLHDSLPDSLREVYDAGKYRKSQQYTRINTRMGQLTSTVSFALLMGMLLLGGFGWLDTWLREISTHPIWLALMFFGLLGLASDLIGTPFDIYDTFVIEERFGFNRTRPFTYLGDKLKGWLLAAILGGGLLAVLVWFYELAGFWFWLYAWGFFMVFSVFMAMFYSSTILPLFNRQTPLEEGPLREAISGLAQKLNFGLDNIFVMDGSRRSSRANAFFTGLGPRKRIVLYDTLLNDFTQDELLAILAHEIGHYRKNHTLKTQFLSAVHAGLLLFLLGIFVDKPALSLALGGQQGSFHLGLLAFALLYSPISLLLGVLGNWISRKFEYEADRFAVAQTSSVALSSALKKLSVNNLSNLSPHPAYVFLHYSHPPLLQRLGAIGILNESSKNNKP